MVEWVDGDAINWQDIVYLDVITGWGELDCVICRKITCNIDQTVRNTNLGQRWEIGLDMYICEYSDDNLKVMVEAVGRLKFLILSSAKTMFLSKVIFWHNTGG